MSSMISTDKVLKKYLGFRENDKLESDDFLEDIKKWCETRDAVTFAILLNSKTAVGTISMSRIHSREKSARIGYWIGSDYRSNGYCTTAFKLVVNEAAGMDLTKLISTIAEDNSHSRQIWDKLVLCQEIAVASCWLSRAPAALLAQLHSGAMRINHCLAGTQDSCALYRHLIRDRVLSGYVTGEDKGRLSYELLCRQGL